MELKEIIFRQLLTEYSGHLGNWLPPWKRAQRMVESRHWPGEWHAQIRVIVLVNRRGYDLGQ